MANVPLPLIAFKLEGRVIKDNEEQDPNVLLPLISVRLVGRVIKDNEVQ